MIDVWQAEVRVSVRGLPVLLSEQTAAHYCPIELGTVAGAHVVTLAGQVPRTDTVTPEPSQSGVPGGAMCLASVYLLDPQRRCRCSGRT